jgi:type II restriction/modification system DNA methylase subunit YeeA
MMIFLQPIYLTLLQRQNLPQLPRYEINKVFTEEKMVKDNYKLIKFPKSRIGTFDVGVIGSKKHMFRL